MSKSCCSNNHNDEHETEHNGHGHGHSHGGAVEEMDGRTRMILELDGMHCAD